MDVTQMQTYTSTRPGSARLGLQLLTRAADERRRLADCQKQIEALFMIELNRAARQTAWKKNIYTSSLRNTDV